MIYIYQADTERYRGESSLTELLKKLPVELHERALRYKFEQDAYNFVVGKLLLKEGLEKLDVRSQLADIVYQENDKPLLDEIYFNISHSKNLVLCALSKDGILGVDIEQKREVNLDHFKPWFTKNEWHDILGTENKHNRLLWYWTRKESIIKALGINLSHLHEIEVDATQDHFLDNNKKWYLKDLKLNKAFIGAICSENTIDQLTYI